MCNVLIALIDYYTFILFAFCTELVVEVASVLFLQGGSFKPTFFPNKQKILEES